MDPVIRERLVPDTYIDMNELMGLKGKDALRGLGHTAHQMKTAPERAIFVWCIDKTEYARDLACFLGREDLQIRPASWFPREAGHSPHRYGIVVDHAYKPPKGG